MTLSAATIRMLADKGLSASDIADVAETIVAPARSANAERQARFRAKRAEESVTNNVTSNTAQSNAPGEADPTPSFEISTPLSPPTGGISPQTIAKPVRASKRGTRLAEDWKPPPEWIDWAVGQGLTELEARREAATMADWSRSAKNGAKLDWDAAWRNWIRRTIDEREQKQNRAHSGRSITGMVRRARAP